MIRRVDVGLEIVRRDAQSRHEPGLRDTHVFLHVPVGVWRLEQQLCLQGKVAAGGLRDPERVDAADRVVGGGGTHVGIDGREAVQLEPARQVVEVTRVGPGRGQVLLVALRQGERGEDGGVSGWCAVGGASGDSAKGESHGEENSGDEKALHELPLLRGRHAPLAGTRAASVHAGRAAGGTLHYSKETPSGIAQNAPWPPC